MQRPATASLSATVVESARVPFPGICPPTWRASAAGPALRAEPFGQLPLRLLQVLASQRAMGSAFSFYCCHGALRLRLRSGFGPSYGQSFSNSCISSRETCRDFGQPYRVRASRLCAKSASMLLAPAYASAADNIAPPKARRQRVGFAEGHSHKTRRLPIGSGPVDACPRFMRPRKSQRPLQAKAREPIPRFPFLSVFSTFASHPLLASALKEGRKGSCGRLDRSIG